MSITLAGIAAEELYDGYSKGIPGGPPRVDKKYMVPWADGNAFANALMGISNTSVAGVAGTIFRTFGHQCPESPNLTVLSVGPIEGAGVPTVDDGRPAWEFAIVPVVYGVSPIAFGSGGGGDPDPYNLFTPDGQAYEFCSFDIDYSSEAITIPKTAMKRAEGPSGVINTTIDMLWTVRVATAVVACTVHRVPWLPTDALLGLQQRINDATFMGRGAGTMLFDGAKTRIAYSSDGVRTVDIVEVFKYREKGWNKVPRPDDVTQWDLVTHNGDPAGRTLYEAADLRPLIFGVTLT